LWSLAFGRRPGEELYDLKADPDALSNLAADRGYRSRKAQLRQEMERELKAQGDPRQFGKGAIFDGYIYADESGRNFYERYTRGEKLKAGWVNQSDFEKTPIKR
jgi:N-sulfoglucosamine sulfohydrolase